MDKKNKGDSMNLDNIIKSMTIMEKASLCSGEGFWNLKSIERLHIPSIIMSDGPNGLRKQVASEDILGINESVPATCFPPSVTTASSWNKELLKEIGAAIAEECIQENVSVILGPGINIKRSPLCGRNFEYISEDPYVAGEMASALVNGIQSKGVGACLKHFAVNNQEDRRMSIDAIVDERALREIYLTPFEIAVKKSKPWSVMGAYNKVNGSYCCENKKLLNDILRKEWGFEGVTVTDWGACNDRVEGIKAGLDLEMPSSKGINDKKIAEAVKKGWLDENLLNKTVKRILTLIYNSYKNKRWNYKYNVMKHHELARKAAEESIVLLKNEKNILPINKNKKIALVGELCRKPRFQGSGSSSINPLLLENAYDEFKKSGISFSYAQGYDSSDDLPNYDLITDACNIAKDSDIVLIFAGLTESYESEGFDRVHMKLPKSHNELIRLVAKSNKNIVVVLMGGSPVEMPWINEVKGLLNTYLGGQAGASAVTNVIFGDVNPSGKLAETYPIKLSDNPSYNFYGIDNHLAQYRESIYVGYRYYDTANIDVLFPFGFGLSYTQFEYSDLKVSKNHISDTENLIVKTKIKNVGKIKGAEVVQLYVRDKESTINKPYKELKGFEKIVLDPGEEKTVVFTLDKRSFAYYNVNINDWHVEEGEYEILIGSSSRDIKLKSEVYVKTSQPEVVVPDYRNVAACYYKLNKNNFNITDIEFQALYGRPIPVPENQKEKFTVNSTLEDIGNTFMGKVLYKIAKANIKKFLNTDDENNLSYKMMWKSLKQAPLRSLVLLGDGTITLDNLKTILKLINGTSS